MRIPSQGWAFEELQVAGSSKSLGASVPRLAQSAHVFGAKRTWSHADWALRYLAWWQESCGWGIFQLLPPDSKTPAHGLHLERSL